ncbi:glycosyltransferase [Cohnella yongneupensis]|uniref:Glycosyltransferase n=1 Tax=Cohnella yongneupensis TaxID=425006 RepID=A0ABW0QUX3_9BACL
MKSKLFRAMLLSLCIALCVAPLAQAKSDYWHPAKTRPGLTIPMVKLKCGLQRLWIDHGNWTHKYIVSAIAGLEDKDKVLARLLRNQQDIGNAFKPYYGEEAGNKLAKLLTEHIVLAGKLIDALMKGNAADAAKINKEWYRNADDIAKFLAAANPNWSYPDMKLMLEEHLKFVADQVTARLAKDWDKDIVAFDLGEDHLIKLANMLTAGIIKQFPKKFQ